MQLSTDAEPRNRHRQQAAFAKVRKGEENYARRLRKLAQNISDIIRDLGPHDPPGLVEMLRRYSDTIKPWAESVASRMLAETTRRDKAAWKAHSREMARSLEKEITDAPIGYLLRQELSRQVGLISSIPMGAANDIHEMIIGNLLVGTRFEEVKEHIVKEDLIRRDMLRAGESAKKRATLIARTETSRVAATVTMVRAKQIGGTHYIWRTMRDEAVRQTHIDMEGVVCEWANPPEVDPGKPPYHAGMTFNCRCFAEPIIPDKFL